MTQAEKTIWSWDIESTDWDKILCAAATNNHGDEVTWWGPNSLEGVADLMEKEGGTWMAHYGGGYDVPLLMNTGRPSLNKLLLTGSNILCAEGPKGLRLRDTYPATLAPLAKLGKWVGNDKGDLQRGALEQYSQKEVLEYNLNDCRILGEAMAQALAYQESQDAQRAWTAGGAAVSLLRALEPGTWRSLTKHAVNAEDARNALMGVRGGRVEAFARGKVENVYSIDLKSSYPARYNRRPVGIGLRPAVKGDEYGVWLCRWFWPHRNKIPPAFDASTGTRASYGWCESWLIDEEIAAFHSCGVDVEEIRGWAPNTLAEVGQVFSDTMYEQKESGVPWAKVYLNSLHGKFSESPVKDSWTADYPKKFWEPGGEPQLHADKWWHAFTLDIDKNEDCPPHCQPIASAQILGRARVALWEGMRDIQEAGGRVFYCDTDSIHTDLRPDQLPFPTGGEIGDWAIESGPNVAYYLGPKAYCLIDNATGEIKSALKGAPFKAMKDGVIRDGTFEQAQIEGEGADLREAFFQRCLTGEGAEIRKGGVDNFKGGLKKGGVWAKRDMVRRIKPTGRDKIFKSPTDWHYVAAKEITA